MNCWTFSSVTGQEMIGNCHIATKKKNKKNPLVILKSDQYKVGVQFENVLKSLIFWCTLIELSLNDKIICCVQN